MVMVVSSLNKKVRVAQKPCNHCLPHCSAPAGKLQPDLGEYAICDNPVYTVLPQHTCRELNTVSVVCALKVVSQTFHACDKIPEVNNFRGKEFILAHGLRGFSP
jgi:hypothetical protein